MAKLDHLTRGLIRAFVYRTKVVSITQRLKKTRPKLESLISLARRSSSQVRTIRLIRAKLACGVELAKRLLMMASLYPNPSGGYIRILKLGKRRGDGAHMSIMLASAKLPLAYCGQHVV
ncbi:L17 family ribosomal protein [Candidatus Hodgkinia cicadicola]